MVRFTRDFQPALRCLILASFVAGCASPAIRVLPAARVDGHSLRPPRVEVDKESIPSAKPGMLTRRDESDSMADWLISFYQQHIAGRLNTKCLYVPSCSEYCRICIETAGLLEGIAMSTERLLRCNRSAHRRYSCIEQDGQLKLLDDPQTRLPRNGQGSTKCSTKRP